MKKKAIFSLVILVLVMAAGTLYCLMGQTTFDNTFQGYDIEPPAIPTDSFTVVRQGTFPGFSDTPVTFDEGQNYRELLTALRGQDYLPFPSLPGAPDGGIAIYYLSGCTPECMAYWDGTFLWLPASAPGRWNRFLPLPPHSLGEQLEKISAGQTP